MTDDELMQATLLALTMQNVTGGGGSPPAPVTPYYIHSGDIVVLEIGFVYSEIEYVYDDKPV